MNELLKMMKVDLAEKQKEVDDTDRVARSCGWYNMGPGEIMEREKAAAQVVILKKYIAEIEHQQRENMKENLGE